MTTRQIDTPAVPDHVRQLIEGRNRLMVPATQRAVQLVRAEGEAESGKIPHVTGYGAVYYREGDPGTEYHIWGDYYERIMPGCFDRAIREDDVRSCFNHNPDLVLGRNKSGTLALRSDAVGLFYDATPPDTQTVRDRVITPIDRGDITGSSFMFDVLKRTWLEEERDDRTVIVIQLQEARLYELGPVTFPAYESATTGLRSDLRISQDLAAAIAEHQAERQASELAKQKRARAFAFAQARRRP